MSKIYILFIVILVSIPGLLGAHGLQNAVQNNASYNITNNTSSQNIFEEVISDYQHGVKFKDVIPVAIGILAFSYFIWKTSSILSKREVFKSKNKFTAEGTSISPRRGEIVYVVKYVVVFPIIMYGWVVVCFFFMYALNTSLSFGALALMMVGIISASRIAAHWNEKLAEDIMKFLPFNLLFTLLINPNLNFTQFLGSVERFPIILLELTIFIGFTGVLEGILKLAYFLVSKRRHSPTDPNAPIKKT